MSGPVGDEREGLPVPPEYDRSVTAGGIGRSTKEFAPVGDEREGLQDADARVFLVGLKIARDAHRVSAEFYAQVEALVDRVGQLTQELQEAETRIKDVGDEREGLRPRFVDGIGPPLAQIIEDYAGERTTPARDVVGLAIEVLRLDGVVGQLTQELRTAEYKLGSAVELYEDKLLDMQRRITELEAEHGD